MGRNLRGGGHLMKRIFLLLSICFALALPALAQNTATITASNLTDGGLNPIQSGKLCFTPTDNQGNALGIRSGAGQITNKPQCALISNGAIAPITLVNTLA